jgi:hypothetical protein
VLGGSAEPRQGVGIPPDAGADVSAEAGPDEGAPPGRGMPSAGPPDVLVGVGIPLRPAPPADVDEDGRGMSASPRGPEKFAESDIKEAPQLGCRLVYDTGPERSSREMRVIRPFTRSRTPARISRPPAERHPVRSTPP